MTAKTGMLWLDNDPARTLDDKVARAATRYQDKYGRQPTVCYVRPSALDGIEARQVGLVRLDVDKHTLPHHFLLCEEATAEPNK